MKSIDINEVANFFRVSDEDFKRLLSASDIEVLQETVRELRFIKTTSAKFYQLAGRQLVRKVKTNINRVVTELD
jgi:hypothetical protein